MGRNKDELIKLAEKITGQECKDVLTKKDALKKIACYYLGEEKEFASIADCLESIVEHGATGGGSGGGGSTALYFYSDDNFGGIYLFTPEVPLNINKDTECVACEGHGAYAKNGTIEHNLYQSSLNVVYVDSTSFSYGGSNSRTFTRCPEKDIVFPM